MIKRLIVVIFLAGSHFLYAQPDWRLQLGDDWYNQYGSKGLQVGDKMPDIPLGKVLNNYTGKTRFSDFKGKLLILDFWNTHCPSCIAGFPHMERLQQEFGDQIQIILVNSEETQEEIEKRQQIAKFKLPNLPCIIADRVKTREEYLNSPFYQLFPLRGVPHHVWIDEKGIIRLRGEPLNTYSQKIRDLLAGKEIFVLNSFTIPSLYKTPYYKQLGNFESTPLAYGSFITPYNNEINDISVREINDSIHHVRILLFINENLLNLYLTTVGAYLNPELYSRRLGGNSRNFVIFPKGTDTLLYVDQLDDFGKAVKTDKDFIKSKYCYEQIVPLSMAKEKRQQKMLQDLNEYFAERYHTIATIENRKSKYYALVRTSTTDKVQAANSDTNNEATNYRKKEVTYTKFSSFRLDVLMESIMNKNMSIGYSMHYNQSLNNGSSFMILNETGWSNDKKMDMVLPTYELKTIDDLRKALKPYDLDIIEKEANFNFLVFNQVE